MTIQTARDFLADNNLAIRGARGKLSNDAKAFLAKAIASGTKFSDWDENGKIKVEPVRKPKNLTQAQPRKSSRIERNADATMVRPELEGLVPASELAWTKPERKEHTIVPPVRKENAIAVIDDRGTLIVMTSCKNNHSISRCTCKVIEPHNYLNAQSFELIVSEHA